MNYRKWRLFLAALIVGALLFAGTVQAGEGHVIGVNGIPFEYGTGITFSLSQHPFTDDTVSIVGFGDTVTTKSGSEIRIFRNFKYNSKVYVEYRGAGQYLDEEGRLHAVTVRLYPWISYISDKESPYGYGNISAGGYYGNGSYYLAPKASERVTMTFDFRIRLFEADDMSEITDTSGFCYFQDLDNNEGYAFPSGFEPGAVYRTADTLVQESVEEGMTCYLGTTGNSSSGINASAIGAAFRITPSESLIFRYYSRTGFQFAISGGTVPVQYRILGELPAGYSTSEELAPEDCAVAKYTDTSGEVAQPLWTRHTEVEGYRFSGWKATEDLTGADYTGIPILASAVTVYGSYTPILGSLTVEKTMEEASDPVSGYAFRLYGTAIGQQVVDLTVLTDEDGKAVFEDVPIGTYSLEETECEGSRSITAYVDQEIQTVTITEEEPASSCFRNVPIRMAVHLLDRITEEELDNGSFQILDESGTVVKEVTPVPGHTEILTGLHQGEVYTLVQTEASSGYENRILRKKGYHWSGDDGIFETIDRKLTKAHTFMLTGEPAVQTITVFNRKNMGSITIHKTGTDHNELSGIVFALEDEAGNVQQRKTTDASGDICFAEVPVGTWYLVEEKTGENYQLLAEPVKVKIPLVLNADQVDPESDPGDRTADGTKYYDYDLNFYVENEEQPIYPATGGEPWILWAIGITMIVLGCMGGVGKKKRRAYE